MKKEELGKLLEKLTLEEKIGQMVQFDASLHTAAEEVSATGPAAAMGVTREQIQATGSILNTVGAEKLTAFQKEYLEKSKNKIPMLFMADIIYGYKTIFPIPLGLGATWDPDLVRECMDKVAKESTAAGLHVTFSPMADLVRDPRWGRVLESTGEDAYLNSQFVHAMVEGFQGDLDEEHLASCVKHFAAYGAPEAGREYNTVDMSDRRLHQDYLPAYKAAIDSGCEMVMSSFNIVDGIPASVNKTLMRDILRKEFGFEGVLISDFASIKEVINHGVAEDEEEAAYLAVEAGMDIDMMTDVYASHIKSLIEKGKLKEEQIDEAVMRILTLKNKLGLFEDPYRKAGREREEKVVLCKEHRMLARKTAAQAMVLLENKNHALPLDRKEKIAVIGPYGDCGALNGMWAIHGDTKDTVTFRKGIQDKLSMENDSIEVPFAAGCALLEDTSRLGDFAGLLEKFGTKAENKEEMLSKAREVAEQAETVILCLGEHTLISGEAGSRGDITLPKQQIELLDLIAALGKKLILVITAGRPLVLTEIKDKADAVVYTWFPGTEGGNALADILYGDVNPSGRLSMTFPYGIGQIPIYYNSYMTGRPFKEEESGNRFVSKYVDMPNAPLYPFGYGLSYTDFSYGPVTLSREEMGRGETLNASVPVTNTGTVEGTETVQLYIRDIKGSVVRPVKELKGFQRVSLKPGETREISFTIKEEMLKFYTKDMEFKAEEGKFAVMIGRDSSVTDAVYFQLVSLV